MTENIEKLWAFVRGDTAIHEFENWVYNESSLEALLGSEFYLELISTDFKDPNETYETSSKIKEFLGNFPKNCECITIANIDISALGSERELLIFNSLEEIKSHGDPYWWLSLCRCKICHQNWLVAQETRHYDENCYKRLNQGIAEEILHTNNWPPYFKKYEELLLLCKTTGRKVMYVDPINSIELFYTISDLAKENPNIKILRIMELLNLDAETASILCKKIVQKENVLIDFNEHPE